MSKYKKYKLKYFLSFHGENVEFIRLYKDYDTLCKELSNIKKKENYIRHTEYVLDIIETKL